ncbi:DUF2290 domain-containing protein [Qipengyuania sp. GH1]|uniref:DUF2290 domain-containing protein n=1 Tax=Qipengyuania aestuarii TaxID=2867241 RepID=UPI001C86CBDC|nr:DUF2290 domain-containing protein [Qipengyuania aestuarii]MBX7534512.1 DUF2290 domain-containing protein [Qipengyuania aestuarii]
MLTNVELRAGISRSWEYLSRSEVGQAFAQPVSFSANAEFRAKSRDTDVPYEELYLLGLRDVQYNMILNDFSFFQFSQDSENEYRFAYYPNPYLGSDEAAVSSIKELHEYVSEGVLDYEDYLRSISEVSVTRYPPMIRYEFSASQYDSEWHPASHLHIGIFADWRWGIAKFLNPKLFTLTVLRHLYPNAWRECQGIPSGDRRVTLDEELTTVKGQCGAVPLDFYSNNERNRLHFT